MSSTTTASGAAVDHSPVGHDVPTGPIWLWRDIWTEASRHLTAVGAAAIDNQLHLGWFAPRQPAREIPRNNQPEQCLLPVPDDIEDVYVNASHLKGAGDVHVLIYDVVAGGVGAHGGTEKARAFALGDALGDRDLPRPQPRVWPRLFRKLLKFGGK